MSNSARKKEKQRLKREKKKAQLRRAHAVSPYKRIGDAGETEACYVNSDWRERGLASIYLLQRNPAGGYAMACFLIDLWCVGLKDAWAKLDFSREAFQRQIDHASDTWSVSLTRLDPSQVRRLVAASIRHAQRHGFRLPRHYERFVSMLGPLPPVSDADLAGFGKEGKLLWVGPLDDLRQRLIGCTVEQFMQRPDVDFIAEVGDELSEWVDAEDDEADFDELVDECREILEEHAQALAALLRERCQSTHRVPAERLDDAARVLLATALLREIEGVVPRSGEYEQDWLEANHTAVDEVLIDVLGTPDNLKQTPGVKEATQQAYAVMQELDREQVVKLALEHRAPRLPHSLPDASR